MVQPSLDFDSPQREQPDPAPTRRRRRPTLADKLDAFLSSRIGSWVSVASMAAIAGTSGVRQRRLECEQRGVRLQYPGEYREGLYGVVVLGRKADERRVA